jgi:hypothetical protein
MTLDKSDCKNSTAPPISTGRPRRHIGMARRIALLVLINEYA